MPHVRVLFAVAVVVLVALVRPAGAKVGTPTLDDLSRRADAIALVDVRAIHTVASLRFAEATVIKAYKGLRRGQTIVYLVERTWPCDVSAGAKGERALVFLEDLAGMGWKMRTPPTGVPAALVARFGAGTPQYFLSTAGRGRLVVVGNKVKRGIVRWSFGASASLAQVEAEL